MKYTLFVYFILSLFCFSNSQTVTGKVVNRNNNGLPHLQVQLFTGGEIYTTTTANYPNPLFNGTFTFNNVTSAEEGELPAGYSISNNYPNPFNPVTAIEYALPKAFAVSFKIYGILRREIKTLVHEAEQSGTYEVEFNSERLPGSTYYY